MSKKANEHAERAEKDRAKKARKAQDKIEKTEKDRAESARKSERSKVFREFLIVLTNLKDAVNHAIIMSERVMENINPARWVTKILDRIKRFVLIALNHITAQKNELHAQAWLNHQSVS